MHAWYIKNVDNIFKTKKNSTKNISSIVFFVNFVLFFLSCPLIHFGKHLLYIFLLFCYFFPSFFTFSFVFTFYHISLLFFIFLIWQQFLSFFSIHFLSHWFRRPFYSLHFSIFFQKFIHLFLFFHSILIFSLFVRLSSFV